MRTHRLALVLASFATALQPGLAFADGPVSSVFAPAGPEAERVAHVLLGFLLFLGAVWLAVMLVLLFAIARRRRHVPSHPLAFGPDRDHPAFLIVSSLAVLTGISVLVLTGFAYASQRHLFERPEGEVVIRLTGHQWWWEARYENADATLIATTANELVIPVGRPITLKLESSDVIHSFWVPALMGKQDLIPGRQNLLRLTADRAGTYRGQCAEFCGAQHAHMAILVKAEDPGEFEAWRRRQVEAASAPADDLRRKGREVFLQKACVSCHTVRGTPAGGRVGPDLTHVGSRATLAAGTIPTSRGGLAAWIADPQGLKPGSRMPPVALEPDELDAVAAYLEGLT